MEPMTSDYADHSTIQQLSINNNMDIVRMAIEHWISRSEITASSAYGSHATSKPFNIGDFGCSHGRNSLGPLSAIISQYRKANETNDIVVYHNDLPQNDFSQLFLELYKNPQSYTKQFTNAFPVAVGKSFYKQICASNCIDISIAFNCFHWSSSLTTPHKQSIFYGHTNDEHLKKIWKKDTVNDLVSILSNRAKELSTGGLLITNLLTNDNDAFEESRMFYRQIKNCWEQLAADGTITASEADNMVYPFRYYSYDDIQNAVSHPIVQEYGLRIKFIEQRSTSCPYKQYRSDSADFAERLFRGFCAFTEPTWKSNLKGTREHRNMVWDKYHGLFVKYFSENPSQGCIPNHYYSLIFEKPSDDASSLESGGASC
ncbi:hypothetical protein DFA_00934 [Cavenderia fasciculata]|uniref:SAM dependent carboxyl methyltransferase n=1 Tax=Cavenderia fasciculata TaxID=261658 RepID=F4PUP2_CACFS|nr:uncharacterized protein DFA_00934 [Cavenderia fasciculata]EGG21061.1 hypothetical protein DFA_00934 [Cavenderia fasciculata]|eukprot:XP_004358911.1 hypothetical protein DFA_00934 [Cavenderia fasciculata]